MKNSLIKLLIITAIILQVSLIDKITYSQAYCINEKGTNLYELENKALPGFILGCAGDSLKFLKKRESMMSWRKTNLQDGYFFLDVEFSAKKSGRLLATSYLGARLTKTGIEGKNNDVKWRLVTTDENDWYFLEHNTSGRYLSRQDNKKMALVIPTHMI